MRKRRVLDRGTEDQSAQDHLLALYEVALGTMSHGLCVYDAQQRLALFNQAFRETYKLPADALRKGDAMESVFRHCAVSVGVPTDLVDGLWEGRKASLAAGRAFSKRQHIPDGRVVAVSFRRLPDGGWVGVFEDITRQQDMETQLRQQVERLDLALENMSHGLSMFSADERLIVCNRQYVELYDLDPNVIKPGVTHKQILDNWVARGNHPDGENERIYRGRRKAIKSGKRSQWINFKNGRVIEATSQTMPDGGWVTASVDITAQLSNEAALRDQNLLFNAALNNMSQGLCMYDADRRLIVHNDQYHKIFNYDPEVVKPGIHITEVFRHGVERGTFHTPPEQMLSQRMRALESGVVHYDQVIGDNRTIATSLCPMANGGFVCTFEDITDRRRVEAERKAALIELREQHRLFDAALNNMPHGVSMLDQDLRIIVTNRQWLDMFRLSPEVVKPGITMREVFEHSVAAGNYSNGNADELYNHLTESLRAGVRKFHRNLTNGRTILTSYHAMSDGGWVATYEDITERKRAEEQISHMARHDALTGLPNRVLFREKMDEGLAWVTAEDKSLAVLCLDLDNFKSVNDSLGHPVGDRLLSVVAQRLTQVIEPGDTIARLGGDEFAILQCADQPAGAEKLAQRIADALSDSVAIDDHEFTTSASIGIAVVPTDSVCADNLMKCADLALYRAKADGRARHRFFEPSMDRRLQERRALEIDLRKAFAADQFSLMYQPQVRLLDGELSGLEALLRWNHPERGPVSPAEFIPIAEENGLIVPLGEWVLRRACAEAATWPGDIRVAVNLSAVQFRNRGLVPSVVNALAATGLAPRRLELEITEAVLLQDDEATVSALHQLREFGIRISMDDFGTGYSSLSYLRSFPFDRIKIDRSFIQDGATRDSAAIIRAIAGLGASLGIATTAEGVETAEQLELVRRAGCTEYQGFYYSAPCTTAAVRRLIERRAAAVA
jgi:diguanylate cyclase (GGDEF)-like protein